MLVRGPATLNVRRNAQVPRTLSHGQSRPSWRRKNRPATGVPSAGICYLSAAMVARPRISVNSLSSLHQPLPAELAMGQELGASHVHLIASEPSNTSPEQHATEVLMLEAGYEGAFDREILAPRH